MDKIFKPYLREIEAALQEQLPLRTNTEWQEESFSSLSKCVNDSHIENLTVPCRFLMDLGGKRWRPLLMVLCYKLALDAGKRPVISEDEIFTLTSLVEFAHTASLIHDDIEDSSDTRRGESAVHIKYGLDNALNAGSWLYFQAAAAIQKVNANDSFKAALYELYATLIRRLHLGQAMDIFWHSNAEIFPSPSEYTQMVHLKTGTLSRLAVQAGLLAGGFSSEETEKAGVIAETLGEGFQILDDVQNITSGNPGKNRGDDIVEGKKSLPVLMHIKEKPKDAAKIAYYFQKANYEGISSEAVEKCIELLETGGAIRKSRDRGTKCILESMQSLAHFGGVSGDAESSVLIKKLFAGMIPETV